MADQAIEDFLAESEELLDKLNQDLAVLGDSIATDESNPDLLNGIFRDAHSVKGLAGMFGFEDVAESFTEIGEVEEEHEKRYRKLLTNVKNGTVFKRDKKVKWHCLNCGYIHQGKEAPELCPACKHARAYYELMPENY